VQLESLFDSLRKLRIQSAGSKCDHSRGSKPRSGTAVAELKTEREAHIIDTKVGCRNPKMQP
jgi:hypothetical protein